MVDAQEAMVDADVGRFGGLGTVEWIRYTLPAVSIVPANWGRQPAPPGVGCREPMAGILRGEKRVPCSNGMNRNLRTVYATVRDGLKNEYRGQPDLASRACLSPVSDHRIAILVNQGSDPKVPYQALVIRESAKLF
jgi:hypothetical protein